MGKWSCGYPDGVVNGIDATFFDCPFTLFYVQFGMPILYRCRLYRCRLLSFFVSFFLCFPLFLPFSLSFFPSFFLSYSSIWLTIPSRPFLVFFYISPSFLSFFLDKNQTAVKYRPHWYRPQRHNIYYKAITTEGSIYRLCSF